MVLDRNAETDAWTRQLRKGVLDLAILRHLERGDVHGYALIASLKEAGLMAADGGEATIYQALQRLAKAGLAAMSTDWRRLQHAVDRLLEDA